MSLVGLVFIVCALLVLFDIVTSLLENNKIMDFSKNETLRKSVDLVKKMTAPVYQKVSDSLPEKYRSFAGVSIVPLILFIVLAVIGQMMW